jgi:uncharacterized protein (TIGR00369 family)
MGSRDLARAPVQKKGGRAREPPGLRLIRSGMGRGYSAPIAKLIGFKLTKVGKGSAWIEMDAGPQHANPMGTLHGGVICDISDAAMGIAYVSTLGANESFTTMELKVNFLRPVWTGHIVAKAKVLRKGRSTGLIVCEVIDEKGRLAAFATSTCMTIAGAGRQGLSREKLD